MTFRQVALFTAMLAGSTANAQINGFDGGVNYTLNNGGFDGGNAVFAGSNALDVTTGGYWDATSTFYNTPVAYQQFTASFTYQLLSYPSGDGFSPADGATFVLQSQGLSALGSQGGDLGYSGYGGVGGIAPSVAVALNLWSGTGVGTAFLSGGVSNYMYTAPGAVDLVDDPIGVTIAYNCSVLTETLDDLTSGATFTTSETIDLSSVLGGSTAFVGFTGGTGSGASTQQISGFTYQAVPETPALPVVGLGVLGLALRARRRRA